MTSQSVRDSNRRKTARTTLDSDKYAEFIRGLQIVDVHFRGASFRFSPELRTMDKPPPLSMNMEAKLSSVEPDVFEAVQTLKLEGRAKPKARLLVNMKCELVAVYRTSVEVTPALFDLFKNSTLILNIWPYLREFVQSCTVRAGLPPLVLPLAKPAPQS